MRNLKFNIPAALPMVWVVGLFLSTDARACVSGSTNGPAIVRHNIPNIIVQRDVPVGTILWEGTLDGGTPTVVVKNCNNSPDVRANIKGANTGVTTSTSDFQVWSTNVPGIGYAISHNKVGNPPFAPGWKWPDSFNVTYAGLTLTGTTSSMRLIVTGKGPSGVINAGQYGRWTMSGLPYRNIYINNSPTITRLACSLTTSSISVSLDDVVLGKDLTRVGSTAKPKTFNVGLNCDPNTRINVMMTGTDNTDTGVDGVLQLSRAGATDVAKGVGIQILYNSTPVKLNTNMKLKTSAGGNETFPFIAQYYQTLGTVTSGKANTSMTLNITYQ